MIAIQCDCGRNLKVKDEMAGRRVRCPDCSEPVKVPAAADEEDDWAKMEDELPAEQPRSRSSTKKTVKKVSKKRKSRAPGSGITLKKIFGGFSILGGVALLFVFGHFIFSGEFQPKRLGGFILPFAMIGMGWAWVNGETYGA